MNESPPAFNPDVHPRLPRHPDRHGIAVIGAGGIVEYGQLPAYRKYGFPVLSIASRQRERVDRVGSAWGIDRRFTDWRQAIETPGVEIVDITYPFDEERIEIVRVAAAAGKHILMQKPFAHSLAAAETMVELAQAHGVQLAVNQNARWAPQYRAARLAIEAGWIGQPYFLLHHLQSNQDSAPWFPAHYYAYVDDFQIVEYAVHHVDLVRFWLGQDPVQVRALSGRKPGQVAKGDILATLALEFADKTLATLVENNASQPDIEGTATFLIDGTEGQIRGCAMGPTSFTLQSRRLPGTQTLTFDTAWFPDGLAATMAELMCAIEGQCPLSISGADNLRTLRAVMAALTSARRREA